MNTTQTAIVSLIIMAFIASLPGLYLYTELDSNAGAGNNAPERPLETVEAELPPVPDVSELPETNFTLQRWEEETIPTGDLNINTASSQQLQQLHRVGPATAENIISHREQHGPFEGYQDLIEISGIGPGTVENFIGEINFGE